MTTRLKTRIMSDCIVYIGDNNTLGTASEVTPPIVKPVYVDRQKLYGVGTESLPNGKVEVDDAKISMFSFYEQVLRNIANPFKAVNLKVTGNLMEFENGEVVSNKAADLYIRGRSTEFGLLCEAKGHDDSTSTLNFKVSKARLVVDNEEIIHVDIENDVYIVDGIDIRAEIKKNLGLA